MHVKEKIYTPTPIEMVAIPLLVVILLVAGNFVLIRDTFFPQESTDIALSYVSTVGYYLDNDTINNTGVFVFWMIVGGLSYIIATVTYFAIRVYRSDMDTHQYIASLSARAVEEEKIVRFERLALRSVALVGFIIWFTANVGFVLLFLQNQFKDFVLDFNVVSGILVLVIGSLDIFLLIVLTRLFLLRTRVYGGLGLSEE